jgi:hypothetical protein
MVVSMTCSSQTLVALRRLHDSNPTVVDRSPPIKIVLNSDGSSTKVTPSIINTITANIVDEWDYI